MKFSTTLFSQILQIMPRSSFSRLVYDSKAESHTKAQSKSLREISDGLVITCGKLSPLELRNTPAKSTLSHVNAHRHRELYQDVFFHLRDFCRSESPVKKKKFRFNNKLLSLDSTIGDLCLSLFPWAEFHQTKGAIKLYLLLDHECYLPDFATCRLAIPSKI